MGDVRRRKPAPSVEPESSNNGTVEAATPPPRTAPVWTPSPSSPLNSSFSDDFLSTTNEASATSTTTKGVNMTRAQVQKDEKRIRKFLKRVSAGLVMFGVFAGSVYMGHIFVCALVALIETLLFRELVKVRYSAYFSTIQDTIPLFRTTQWLWFFVALFYTYGDFVSDIISSNQELHRFLKYAKYLPTVSFLLYSGTFVLTIATLQREHIRFQINQLCWTILVIMLTVGQLKYIMHNIFNGLIWYVLPCCLVFVNDIMAYFAGMTWGRKFIQRPFISFSPNKTWEGFLGGALFTLITAWYVSRFLAQYTWMTCPTNEFNLLPDALDCQLDPIFLEASVRIPPQTFMLIPGHLVKMIPRVVEICSTNNYEHHHHGASDFSLPNIMRLQQQEVLTPCISGDESQIHHHFELTLRNYYPIQVHALWLALFASLVAPFGGFLASAIKRAYKIKDFDNLIPGHGGVMDRMDCQFLMALYTWVHYNTFVKLATVSVPKLTYMYSLLSEQEKVEFLESIIAADDDINDGGIGAGGTRLKRLSLHDYSLG